MIPDGAGRQLERDLPILVGNRGACRPAGRERDNGTTAALGNNGSERTKNLVRQSIR